MAIQARRLPSASFAVVFGRACLLLAALVARLDASVVINELMYHPQSDDDGYEFLELYNTDPSPVSLQNWCIDGLEFCFGPGASIAGNGYVVLARDATKFQAKYGFAPGFVYTGQLSNSGERLLLINASLQVVDQVEYHDVGEWPVTPDGEGPSLERIDPLLGADTPRNWRASTHPAGWTPGALNSVAAVGLPPWITEVQHTLNVQPGQSITVTARVADATSVSLSYKLGFAAATTFAMFDDGAHGDGGAGDGVYGYVISGQPANTLVRCQITATGPTGTMRFPRTDDTLNYVGTVVADPSLASPQPIFQWFMDPTDYQHALDHRFTDQTEPAVFFYNGDLFDNIRVRVRGQTARTWAKPNWKFQMPHGHDFFALGLTPVASDNFNLQSHYSDKAYCREILANETLRDCGVPASNVRHVRVQQNGVFFGLFTYLEDHNNSWVSRWGLDSEGARYKAYDNMQDRGSEAALHPYYEKDSRLTEDYSDLYALILGGMTGGPSQKQAFMFDNLDVPAVINYLAANVLFHNNDHPAKNYTLYRDTLGTRRWRFFPWDMDLTFGRNFGAGGGVLSDGIWADVDTIDGRTDVSPSHPLFGDRYHQKYDFIWNTCIDAVLADVKIREMYFRRLRTIMDQMLVPGRYESRIDELIAPIGAEVELDHALWGQYGEPQTLTQAVNLLKNSYLTPRRTHLFSTHRVPGEIPAAQSIAPIVVINEVMYRPVGDESLAEFVELYNPSATESVDISSWRLDGAALTIPYGVVVLPHDFVLFVRNDVGFRATCGGGRFIGAQYHGELANQGETLMLRDQNGRIVDQVNYEAMPPWPTSANGGGMSLERIDPARPGTYPSNWAASLSAGGTPAAPNSRAGTRADLPALYLNEVLPVNTAVNRDDHDEFAPWIELFNGTSETINLAGLYLTDDYNQPLNWAFSSGTQLCAGQRMLIWADNQPAQGSLHANFALNAAGGSVGLCTASGALIDYLNYPAMGANFSYGRFPDGAANRVQFETPTPLHPNRTVATPVILNEYNAVMPGKFIKNNASDTYFGRVLGNGGDWFELVVTRNHLDMRGWQFVIVDNGLPNQTLTLTNQAIWSDLRAGTIITICESVPDDVSYDPANGDWWINVRAGAAGTGVYISALDFEVDHRNWQLTIKDAQGQVVFGPAGEGIQPASGIGDDEVFKLEENPGEFITSHSNFNDGSSSTFGSPNLFNSGTQVQDFSALRAQFVSCTVEGQCADDDPCTIDACINGECFHTPAAPCYRLSLDVVGDVGGQVSTCPGPLDVRLNLAGLVSSVNGVQVLLRYNTARLSLQGITPGGGVDSPWNAALPVAFTDTAGAVTYALILLGTGTTTDATVATLHFTALPPGSATADTQVIFDPPASCSVFRTKLTTGANATILPTTIDSGRINVGPRVTVDLEMEGLSHAVTRDVRFVLTDCNGLVSQMVTKPVAFSAGHGQVVLTGISPQVSWISAAEGHSLRRLVPLVFNSCCAAVQFTGSNRLIAGDFQTAGVPQDNFVDILDFAILASRWNTLVGDCAAGAPADCAYGADVTGDGLQDTADFTAIQINFFKSGDALHACPPVRAKAIVSAFATDSEDVAVLPRTRLDVQAAAVRRLAPTADLDGNGVVDAQDIRLFAARNGLAILPEFEIRLRELDSQAARSAAPGDGRSAP